MRQFYHTFVADMSVLLFIIVFLGIGAWDNIQNMRMKEVKRMQV